MLVFSPGLLRDSSWTDGHLLKCIPITETMLRVTPESLYMRNLGGTRTFGLTETTRQKHEQYLQGSEVFLY